MFGEFEMGTQLMTFMHTLNICKPDVQVAKTYGQATSQPPAAEN